MNDEMGHAEWAVWETKARELLASNRMEVGAYRFTRPAPGTYEQQWLWDSAFHAIIYRWLDPEMAGDELLSATAHQLDSGADEGMIPHMTYWRGGGEELWGIAEHSLITQPPLFGVAAQLIYERSGDLELLEALYPRLERYHNWFERRRDPDGDGLVSIIHPWESWDASPRWDSLLGLAPFSHERGRQARMALAQQIRAYDCEVAALAQEGIFNVEPIDINSIRAADLEALAFIAEELEKREEAARWQAKAQTVQRAVSEKLLANGAHDLAGTAETPIRVESASNFIALFGGCATPKQAAQLVERLHQGNYWTPYPVPTTPTTAADYAPEVYWRGNVWLPVNWLIYRGLRRYNYEALAHDLAARSMRLVAENGFWEFYHPLSGQGGGAKQQSWSALVLDLLGQERERNH